MRTVPRARATRTPTVMVVMVSAAVIAGATTGAPAQSVRNLERPGHWKVRYDDGAGAGLSLHVTEVAIGPNRRDG